MIKDYKDNNPLETQDWLDSIEALIEEEGLDRAYFILDQIIDFARRNGIRMPYSANTSYVNTIPVSQQVPYPGNREIERRIKSIIRWNAMAMVVKANRDNPGIGGHISSYASAATLYEVGFNHFFRGPDDPSGGDLIFFQGHTSPGLYARAYLEGRLTDTKLHNFRRELKEYGGLSSYPHPWLMPDFWQFATVSMGLGPIMAIYQARFMRYMADREIIKDSGRKIWAFLGDGEMDEPEALGAITLASREKLDNLIFVVNCNLQRLDGPVRGNSKVIQELEGAFRGAGWNVIKVVWGSDWDALLDRDNDGTLVKRMDEIVDGHSLKYVVESGKHIREHFFGAYPQLVKMVEHLTDDELWKLRMGGHDPAKVYSAFAEATEHKNQPTVILARTIKGYGMGEAGEGRNITHSQKKLNEDELLYFRSRFDIPLSDDECKKAPFYNPGKDSPEIKYLKERRQKLGGFQPIRRHGAEKLDTPDLNSFKSLLAGSGNREFSTTMAFVKLLTLLTKDKKIGKNIVPIIPDEARTFGIDPLFRQLGIYSHVGQIYDPVDSDQYLYYREDKKGQILEEGITEAGAISSFIAAGMAHSTYGKNMIPFYIYYSMFGFQRVGDFIWAAADMRVRGFLIGATSGRTTLAGEGLQHQDGHSLLAASVVPNLKAYDPAYSYELAVIIQDGLKQLYHNGKDIFYYITVQNENYSHPEMPEKTQDGIVKGLYCIQKAKPNMPKVRLLGSGSLLREAKAAAELLEKDWNITSEIWSVTSYSELRKESENIRRWNTLHPDKKQKTCWLNKNLGDCSSPIIAVSDYVKLVSEQIAAYIPCSFSVLGTDGFGRSDNRESLREFFEVNRFYIVLSAINALYKEGKLDQSVVLNSIEKYKIDTEKPNPLEM
jgi:pyruvate dehydrogenase E1 component